MLRRILLAGTGVAAAGALFFVAPGVRGELVAVGKVAPEIVKGHWVNSEPLSIQGLRGRVVLIDFWTYG